MVHLTLSYGKMLPPTTLPLCPPSTMGPGPTVSVALSLTPRKQKHMIATLHTVSLAWLCMVTSQQARDLVDAHWHCHTGACLHCHAVWCAHCLDALPCVCVAMLPAVLYACCIDCCIICLWCGMLCSCVPMPMFASSQLQCSATQSMQIVCWCC